MKPRKKASWKIPTPKTLPPRINNRMPYPTDLIDGQWKKISAMIPPPGSNKKIGGRERTVDI